MFNIFNTPYNGFVVKWNFSCQLEFFKKFSPALWSLDFNFHLYRMLISKCVIANTCSESLLNSVDGMGLNFGIGGFLKKAWVSTKNTVLYSV